MYICSLALNVSVSTKWIPLHFCVLVWYQTRGRCNIAERRKCSPGGGGGSIAPECLHKSARLWVVHCALAVVAAAPARYVGKRSKEFSGLCPARKFLLLPLIVLLLVNVTSYIASVHVYNYHKLVKLTFGHRFVWFFWWHHHFWQRKKSSIKQPKMWIWALGQEGYMTRLIQMNLAM